VLCDRNIGSIYLTSERYQVVSRLTSGGLTALILMRERRRRVSTSGA
jgi:hypothetical protein